MKPQSILLFCIAILFSVSAYGELESMRARVPQIIALKDKGVIGEKKDGLLGLVQSGNSEGQSVVAEENKDRLSVYKERAKKGGHSLPTFMKVMGDERIKQEPAGRYIQNASGQWVKK